MIVVGDKRPADAMDGQELRRDAGILGEHGIRRCEGRKGAEGNVAQVADGRRHHMQAVPDGFGFGLQPEGREGGHGGCFSGLHGRDDPQLLRLVL